MVERLRGGHAGEGLPRALAERSARGGEHEAADLLRAPAVQALMDRAVLAVDGEDPAAARARGLDHQLPRHHQRLLVGQGHVLARLQRAIGRDQAHGPHRGRHHDRGVGVRRHRDAAFLADLHPGLSEVRAAAQLLGRGRSGHGGHTGAVAGHLGRQSLHVAARRESDDAETVRERVHDPEDVRAHRSRRAEDGKTFIRRSSTGIFTGIFTGPET
jgi:hypothetical protein